MSTILFHPSLLLRCLDPGSEIRDPGWVKNQDPGSGINILDPQQCQLMYILCLPTSLFHCEGRQVEAEVV
jgi:hypothetical protein